MASVHVNRCWAQNDSPRMPADCCDCIPTHGGRMECFDPQSRRAVRVLGGRAEESPFARPSGARVPVSGVSDPGPFGLAEFKLWGLLVPVIASSKL
jgi:hypothetical protein